MIQTSGLKLLRQMKFTRMKYFVANRIYASTETTKKVFDSENFVSVGLGNRIKLTQPHSLDAFEIVFLGTGGSAPSKSRGLSSLAIVVGRENWLFDVGEGTVRQRLFSGLNMQTSKIFISHLHMSNVLGLPAMLCALCAHRSHDELPIQIYGPKGLHKYICTNLKLSDSHLQRSIIVYEFIIGDEDIRYFSENVPVPISWLDRRRELEYHPDEPELFSAEFGSTVQRMELRSIGNNIWECFDDMKVKVRASLVCHSVPCFAYVIEESAKGGSWIGDSNFWKSHNPKLISYLKLGYELILENGEILSPDTHLDKAIPGRKAVIVADSSYTATLSNIARDCDVLVHEASYVSAEEAAAILKHQSTTKNACEVAKIIGAKTLLLNRIRCQFLPIDFSLSYNDKRKATNRSDNVLLEEAEEFLQGSGISVHVARDFNRFTVPVGGVRETFPLVKSILASRGSEGFAFMGSAIRFREQQTRYLKAKTENQANDKVSPIHTHSQSAASPTTELPRQSHATNSNSVRSNTRKNQAVSHGENNLPADDRHSDSCDLKTKAKSDSNEISNQH